jgi:hypothetical protein
MNIRPSNTLVLEPDPFTMTMSYVYFPGSKASDVSGGMYSSIILVFALRWLVISAFADIEEA